jgi:class 3 adenylate cyclase
LSEVVTATFVFTDLVDSTATASSLTREAADEVRVVHFELLRGAITAAGGVEVKNLGDGLMVMFTSATRALASAVAMQQAVERHNRRADVPVGMKVGIATGDATEEDGDYFGDPVVEAARLCAAATGGEILATELFANLVGRHGEQEMVPLGALELKGLAPLPAVSVRWEPETQADDGAGVPLPAQLVGVGNESLFAFFGRAAELETIASAVKSATSDRRLRALFIGGEPGMGKTSLAAQAARAAHAAGATVLFGGCAEGLCPPHGPWMAALSHLITSSAPDSFDQLSAVHANVLRRLLPADASRLPTGDDVAMDADSERFLRMEAVVALLSTTSEDTPVVVVLDDAQWADDASLAQLRHLVASPASLAVVVVVTYRSSDVVRRDPLGMLLADAHRDARSERIDLKGLSDADIVELITAAAGYELDDEGVALAHALHRETDGNAFFVTEMLRHLAESGEIAPGDDGRYSLVRGIDGLSLPESVRDVVGQRVARLGPDTERALAAAAVIGPEFDVGLLSAVTDVDEDALLDVLDQASAAALISESPSGDSYRFAHALVQHSIAQTISAARRQRLHRRIAETLEESGSASTAELARHWIAATRPADAAKAREYAKQAGDEALAAVAPADAIRWYQQALELVDQEREPHERDRCLLLVGLGRAHLDNGSPLEGRAVVERAGDIAGAIDDDELIVTTALGLSLGQNMFDVGSEQSRAMARRAIESVGFGDHAVRARLMAILAEATDAREWRTRHALIADARAEARLSSDQDLEAEIAEATYAMWATPDLLAQRLAETERAVEHPRLSALGGGMYALNQRAQAVLESGDRESFEDCVAQFEVLADRLGLPMLRSNVASLHCVLRIMDGDAAAAEVSAFESYDYASSAGHPSSGEPLLGIQLVHIRRLQGRLDEVVDAFAAAADGDAAAGMPVFQITLAMLQADVGDVASAAARYAAITADGYDDLLPRDQLWLTATVHASAIATAVGDLDGVRALRAQLAPFEAHHATSGMTYDSTVATALARLDAALGDTAEAERHHVMGIEGLRRMRSQYWLAEALLDHAAFLRDTAPDEPRVEAEHAEGVAIAERHGFAGLLART